MPRGRSPAPPAASGGGGGPGARASLAMMRWWGRRPARPANRWSRAAAPPTGDDSRVLQALGPGRRRAAASPSGSGSRDGSGHGQSASTVCSPGLGGCRAAGVGARCEPIVWGPHRLPSRRRGAGVARRARAPAVRTPARVAGPAPRYPPSAAGPPRGVGRSTERTAVPLWDLVTVGALEHDTSQIVAGHLVRGLS